MRQLSVSNFSCINQATLDIGQLTILVGPQASGKSVLSKLCYFFLGLLTRDQPLLIEEGKDLKQFKDHIREQFKEWFPVSAWGKRKFTITFTLGKFEIRISRIERAGKVSNNLRLWMSSPFERHYKSIGTSAKDRAKRLTSPEHSFEFSYRIRELSEKLLKEELGDDYIPYQLFVPAGRSFFTTIGKAVAAFEQARILEPVTLQFGRYFAAIRDQRRRRELAFRGSKFLEVKFSQLLGGRLNFERDREYIDSQDGRRVPFSALSSGQQELLPLLMTLEYWGPGSFGASSNRRLLYIEEPEAHLFPSAQSLLVEALASLVVRPKVKEWLGLVITTHSPYVLAKFNNLIKAGGIAESASDQVRKRIAAVVEQSAWIAPGTVKAYALRDGELCPLIDASGLINAEYLDEVSGDIAKEFSTLLEIEFSHVNS